MSISLGKPSKPHKIIYLLDINKTMTDAWYKYFNGALNVKIVNDYFSNFMNEHPEVEGIVSPANSFGLMDGGYDKAIIDYLGKAAQTNVLTILDAVYSGYQPIGTCLSVPFYKYTILHTPTMRTPEQIVDKRVIYDCMRSCLLESLKARHDYIVIPAFGGLTGGVPYDEIARLMFLAYTEVYNKRDTTDWGYAKYIANELRK